MLVSIPLNPQKKKEIRDEARKAIEELSKEKRFIGPLDRSEGAPSRWSRLYYAMLDFKDGNSDYGSLYDMNAEELIDLADKTLRFLYSEIKSI